MTPGTLFFDKNFQFHDGESGQKILVALATGHGITIVVKTTSRGRRYRNEYGCQAKHRFPNFHLVKDCCCLNKPTWVCLDEYYEFNDNELLQCHFSGDVNRIGELPDTVTIALLECSIVSQDINIRQSTIVTSALNAYRNSSQ